MCGEEIPAIELHSNKSNQLRSSISWWLLRKSKMEYNSIRPFEVDNVTCSKACHEALIDKLEKEFGKYKKVVDYVHGKTHRVPTRHIIEKGLKFSELNDFPLWSEAI